MIGHFLGAIDGYGKHSDAYIHGSGKLRQAIGSIHLHRIDFRSYPFGIDIDSRDNIQSIPLQAGIGDKSGTKTSHAKHYSIVPLGETEKLAKRLLEILYRISYACFTLDAEKREIFCYL